MCEQSKPNSLEPYNPKRIILFRFDENPGICRNHLELLKKYNPDVAVHGLYGGPQERLDDFKKSLDPYLSTIFCGMNTARSWHKMNQDLAIRQWFRDDGSRLEFDVVHVVDENMLMLDCLENLYAPVAPGGLGLPGLIPFEKLKNRHKWVDLESFKQPWQQLLDTAAGQSGYSGQPYTCVLAGACFPKTFLEKYADLDIPELVHGEMRIPLYAQILGFDMHDTGFYKSWFHDAENRFFNLGERNIRYDSILCELQKKGGVRMFRPYTDEFHFFCSWDQAPTLKGIERYELDTRRVLCAYEQFSGVNLNKATAEVFSAARLGSRERILPQALGPLRPVAAAPRPGDFCPSLHKLNQAMDVLEIQTLVDIGCFLPQAAQLNRRLRAYTGLHTEAGQLEALAQAYAADDRLCFLALPAECVTLPVADIIAVDADLMAEQDCWYIFNMIKAARARYVVAPLQVLRAAPFGFPEPERLARCAGRLLGFWPLDRHMRRFFAKEPQAIRTIRAPLVERLLRDLHRLHAVFSDDCRTKALIRLFNQSESKHAGLFKSAGLESFFVEHGIIDIYEQLRGLIYMRPNDRFLADYSLFATQDPQTRRIHSYLAREALIDFGAQHKLYWETPAAICASK